MWYAASLLCTFAGMKSVCAALVSILFLAACSGNWKPVRQGTWAGTAYRIEERISAGMFASTNSLDWRIQVGKIPAVLVAPTTTDWGPPYSTDIYGADAYSFITARDTAYVDTPFTPGSIGVAHTMLYVSPRVLDEDEYETFLRFMTEEFPRLSDSLTGTDLRGFPHIIGLVYGEQQKYARDFRGTHEGKSRILRIQPDGRVRLIESDKWANEVYSGLAEKVGMPGKVLRSKGDGLTRGDLRGFRDARGVPVDSVFRVEDVSAR